MSDEPITTHAEDDVEAHLLKEALATGAAAAAVLAGAGAATAAPTPQSHSAPRAAVLPDPGAMPGSKAPPIRLARDHSKKAHKTTKPAKPTKPSRNVIRPGGPQIT